MKPSKSKAPCSGAASSLTLVISANFPLDNNGHLPASYCRNFGRDRVRKMLEAHRFALAYHRGW